MAVKHLNFAGKHPVGSKAASTGAVGGARAVQSHARAASQLKSTLSKVANAAVASAKKPAAAASLRRAASSVAANAMKGVNVSKPGTKSGSISTYKDRHGLERIVRGGYGVGMGITKTSKKKGK